MKHVKPILGEIHGFELGNSHSNPSPHLQLGRKQSQGSPEAPGQQHIQVLVLLLLSLL